MPPALAVPAHSQPIGDFHPIANLDRLRVGATSPAEDALYQAAVAGTIAWSPLPGEAGTKLRRHLQTLDARTAARTLALAGLLSLNRATLLPWWVGKLMHEFPPAERQQFAGYLDPLSIQTAFLLAAFLLATAFLAARRPLVASCAALGGFLIVSAPLVWHNPVLLGGGHLGRLVMLLLLLRALWAGITYRLR